MTYVCDDVTHVGDDACGDDKGGAAGPTVLRSCICDRGAWRAIPSVCGYVCMNMCAYLCMNECMCISMYGVWYTYVMM